MVEYYRTDPLQAAVRDGDKYTIQQLLSVYDTSDKKRAAVETSDEEGVNSLHLAAEHGSRDVLRGVETRADVVKFLLSLYDSVDSQIAVIQACDITGKTVLHYAVIGNNLDIIKYVLDVFDSAEKKVAAIAVPDKEGRNALHIAAQKSGADVINILVGAHDSISVAVEVTDTYGRTPLHYAAKESSKEAVELLLNVYETAERRIAAIELLDVQGRSVLQHAAFKNDTAMVSVILSAYDTVAKRCAAIGMVDEWGNTPLRTAAQNNNMNMVELLVNAYCPAVNESLVCVPDDNVIRSALCCAAENDNKDMVLLLLNLYPSRESESEVLCSNPADGWEHNTFLCASRKHLTAMIEFILRHYDSDEKQMAAVVAVDNRGFTAFHYAAASNNMAMMEILLGVFQTDAEKRLAIRTNDRWGRSPLQRAVECEHPAMVKFVLSMYELPIDKRKAVELKDITGMSVLQSAIMIGNSHILEILLAVYDTPEEKSTSIEVTDSLGQHVLLHAAQMNRCDMVKLLLSTYNTLVKKRLAIELCDKLGRNALHFAALRNNIDMVIVVLAVCRTAEEKVAIINTRNEQGLSALHYAIANKNCAMIELLLDVYRSCDKMLEAIEMKDKRGRKTVCYVSFTILEIIQQAWGYGNENADLNDIFLSNSGAQLESTEPDDESMSSAEPTLQPCSQDSSSHVMKLLLNVYDTPQKKMSAVEYTGEDGQNVLHYAVSRSDKDLVECLLDVYQTVEDKRRVIEIANVVGHNLWHLAILLNNKEMMKFFLECYPHAEEKSRAIENIATGWHNLLHYGDTEMSTLLLGMFDTAEKRNTVIDAALEREETIVALPFPQIKKLMEVLQRGYLTSEKRIAAIEGLRNNGFNVLHPAILHCDKPAIELILSFYNSEEGRIAVKLPNMHGHNAIHLSAMQPEPAIADMLLRLFDTVEERFALVLAVDENGCNALHLAAQRDHFRTFDVLLIFREAEKIGEAVSVCDEKGWSVLHYALRNAFCHGKTSVCWYILRNYPNLMNQENKVGSLALKDTYGRNCLHFESSWEVRRVIQALHILADALEPHELETIILTTDVNGNTHIHNACELFQGELLLMFFKHLKKVSPVNRRKLLESRNSLGHSPLDLINGRPSELRKRTLKAAHEFLRTFYVDPDAPGVALILCNTISRPKWQRETELASSFFAKLGIKVCSVIGDKSANELKNEVGLFIGRNQRSSSIWLCVMSHGSRGSVLQCSDNSELALQSLIHLFTASVIADIPKVLIANHCRDLSNTQDGCSVIPYLYGKNILLVESVVHTQKSIRMRFLQSLNKSVDGVDTEVVDVEDIMRDASASAVAEGEQLPERNSTFLKSFSLHLKQNL